MTIDDIRFAIVNKWACDKPTASYVIIEFIKELELAGYKIVKSPTEEG